MRIIALILILGVVLSLCPYAHADVDVIENAYQPPNGFVPDETTAIKIAEAVWLPIYGDLIYDEKPFIVELTDRVWTVMGTQSKERPLGGVAICQISQDTGEIIGVSHGK